MKQKRFLINFYGYHSLILIFLATASLLYLSGCATKSSQVAQAKASTDVPGFWEISRVVLALKQENGDISVCFELYIPGETYKPLLGTITIPFSNLTGDTDGIANFNPKFEECKVHNSTCCWYPMAKVKIGCESVAPGPGCLASVIPVENISINSKDRIQLDALFIDHSSGQPIADKIYEVSFLSNKEDTKKEADANNEEVIDKSAEVSKDKLLIYFPARFVQQGIQPISIAGAYGFKSINDDKIAIGDKSISEDNWGVSVFFFFFFFSDLILFIIETIQLF